MAVPLGSGGAPNQERWPHVILVPVAHHRTSHSPIGSVAVIAIAHLLLILAPPGPTLASPPGAAHRGHGRRTTRPIVAPVASASRAEDNSSRAKVVMGSDTNWSPNMSRTTLAASRARAG